MITSNKYLILDSISNVYKISEKLCIINFNIIKYSNILSDFIKINQNTTFWAATKDFSKKYIRCAGKLGIKNVISFPIKKELIDNFFNSSETVKDSISTYNNYEKLKNSEVIIIDDNKLNIELLEEILSDLGAHITSFDNPLESLELINSKKISLFLLDILMPEISGFELAEKIKESELNKNTPIIFISAVSGNENIINGYSLGAHSYIEKPFSPAIVKAQIYNLLKSGEEKNEQDKLSETFVANLTHDLKSPINAEICALKYLLKKQNYPNLKTEILSELLNSAQYMKLITDKILCHYKQKNSVPDLNLDFVNISCFVLECIEEIRFICDDKNIDIRLNDDCDNVIVSIDKIEIKRVINNLLSNAVEYSHKNGSVEVYLSNDDKFFVFTVKDYGIGFDLEQYKSVFNEYMSLSKKYKKIGFGLGLNICKTIVEAHNGEIFIDSKPNKGTIVTFKIPVIM